MTAKCCYSPVYVYTKAYTILFFFAMISQRQIATKLCICKGIYSGVFPHELNQLCYRLYICQMAGSPQLSRFCD